eukprot:CAMPEP_0197031768 /NCGR_PEP_ID=MMETSP1384-20130603/10664_1 /TAXON_ID=29189 /ORGANISM="Ammonia sp." /LENGTH=88 /DNA_ID=CAMNT_0042461343 /DNA_START=27 /DNA_END=290 /DNA_ORIENTATION=-
MADMQAQYDKYMSQYGSKPNPAQLAGFANCKYSDATNFLRNLKKGRTTTSTSVSSAPSSSLTTSSPAKPRTGSFSDEVLYGDAKPATT